MTMVRNALTSKGGTRRQNEASTSTVLRQSSPLAESRPLSSADTFSEEGDQANRLRVLGRHLDSSWGHASASRELVDTIYQNSIPATEHIGPEPSEGPSEAVPDQTTKTCGGEALKLPADALAEHGCKQKHKRSDSASLPAEYQSNHFLNAEQRQGILHAFVNDSTRSNAAIAQQFGINRKTILTLRQQFNTTGNIDPGNKANRLSSKQRQEILQMFISNSTRNNTDIARQFSVTYKTISTLRQRFNTTGNLEPGNKANRLSAEQRQEISRIFIDNPARSNMDIAQQFHVTYKTISLLRQQFNTTGNIDPKDHSYRLNIEQRQEILHSFINDSSKSNTDIARQLHVSPQLIGRLRQQFNAIGNIDPRDTANRLSSEQRQEILRTFIDYPTKSTANIANQFGVAQTTISALRQQFNATGNIAPRDTANRLSAEQHQEILHIFINHPTRSNADIANQFHVAQTTISTLRQQFNATGNIAPRDNHLSAEQHQEILHIFINESARSNVDIANQFGVSRQTIGRKRHRFNATGNIDQWNKANRLSAEQRQEILHIFINESTKSNASIARRFGVTQTTISRLRQQFNETGTIGPGGKPIGPSERDQEMRGTLIGSSKMASSTKSSKRPADPSAETEPAGVQKRIRSDSAPLYAEQTADQPSSTGIRIFGVQIYPAKAAQQPNMN